MSESGSRETGEDRAADQPETGKPIRVAGRWVAAAVVIAMALGFMIGRWVFGGGTSTVGVVDAPSSGPSTVASSTPHMTLVPYEGEVVATRIVAAFGDCNNLGDQSDAQNLADEAELTIWRCAGAGDDVELIFDLPSGESIVGVRIINGNTADQERYLLERRLTNIKWVFPDGSWVSQGLAANTPEPQEIRFPPIRGGIVRLQIVDVTAPGDDEAGSDAVAISHLEFLTPS